LVNKKKTKKKQQKKNRRNTNKTNKMNDFTKLSSSSPKHRLDSRVTLITANCRDYDNKCKLERYQRQLEQEYLASEKNMKRIQKWQLRVEKNNIIKSQCSLSQEQLTPSVDEWLSDKKLRARRHSMLHRTQQINK